MKYIKELDSIRAFAVILVIISHWVSNNYVDLFGFGYVGVDIFFVLSGFLITRILLDNKNEAEAHNYSKMRVIKNFIIRRTLRIFPIYYITITLLYILGDRTGTEIREDFLSYLTYTSNFLFFSKQSWDGMLSHLWSLGVEEQFYLFWPWVMIFVKKKHIFKTIVIFFVIGVLSNFALLVFDSDPAFIAILTPTCFDSFSLGAILAYIMVYEQEKLPAFSKYLSYIALVSFVIFVGGILLQINFYIPTRTLVSICSLYLIIFAIRNKGSIIHRTILNNQLLIFIGKISYGIYLYHNLMPIYYWDSAVRRIESMDFNFLFVNSKEIATVLYKLSFFANFAILLLISWISWKVIEYPVNSLKSKFEYKKARV